MSAVSTILTHVQSCVSCCRSLDRMGDQAYTLEKQTLGCAFVLVYRWEKPIVDLKCWREGWVDFCNRRQLRRYSETVASRGWLWHGTWYLEGNNGDPCVEFTSTPVHISKWDLLIFGYRTMLFKRVLQSTYYSMSSLLLPWAIHPTSDQKQNIFANLSHFFITLVGSFGVFVIWFVMCKASPERNNLFSTIIQGNKRWEWGVWGRWCWGYWESLFY